MEKIWSLDDLETLLRVREKELTARLVLCHGVFDVLHVVHLQHLEWARGLGTCLIVSLTPDAAVQKGPGRPYFSQDHRAKQIEAIQAVDFVVCNQDLDACGIITRLKPHIYAKGKDVERRPTPGLERERAAVAAYGGKVMFGPDIPEVHSTDVFNHYM